MSETIIQALVMVKGVSDLNEEERESFVLGALIFLGLFVFFANLTFWLFQDTFGKPPTQKTEEEPK